MAKIKVVCPKCGSDDVCRDACARWDVGSQSWSLSTEYDDMTCEACGYEGHSFAEAPVDVIPETMDDHQIVLAIQELLDGVEWDSATPEAIAAILIDSGTRYEIEDGR